MNRLWKEIHRLLRKEMSNIYLKVTTFSNFDFLGLNDLSPGHADII